MVTVEKPNAVVITVRDRKSNKSKSITVYDATLDEIFNKIQRMLK